MISEVFERLSLLLALFLDLSLTKFFTNEGSKWELNFTEANLEILGSDEEATGSNLVVVVVVA